MHNVKSSVRIPILVTALACSLAFNLVQYAAKKAPLPPLGGTYRTAETTPGAGAYLVLTATGITAGTRKRKACLKSGHMPKGEKTRFP